MAQAKREWVGGRFALEATVQELGDQAPTVTLWLELPEGVVVGQGVDGPGATAATFAESLAAATREPLTGPARRPELVRVASEELAAGVRALGFEVTVAPTPELDDLVASLTAMMRRGTYFDDPSTTTVALERFFRAARGLWERAPWSDVDDTCILELDVPAHDLQGAVLSIVGAYDQAYGFALFPSFAAFDEASDAAPPGSTSALYLSFDPRSELPRQMVDEVAQHGWPLASEQAYPFLMRLEGGAPVPVGARDYELATAVMSTLETFLEKHTAAFADFGSLYVEESLEEAGVAVTLRMPHPHWVEEGPAARALTLSSDNPYELPLTDAELRALQKKLAPRTLHRVMGTLCAVASVPAPIPPSVWLNKLLEEVTFKGEAEFTAQSRLLFASYDHVLDVFDQDCIDMLVPEAEDEAACRDWAQGYLAMMPHAGPTALREELVDVLFDLQTVAEEPRVLQVLDRVRGEKSRDTFRSEARERLADDAARLLEVWAEARDQVPEAEAPPEPIKREAPKVGRNDPCPCGSGKKAKKCCGAAS